MRTSRKILYLVCLTALAVTAALAFAGVGRPSIVRLLVWPAIVAALAGAPGLIHRRAWPLALVLLPAGAYLILRAQMHVPTEFQGLQEHYSFYLEVIRSAVRTYLTSRLPLDPASSVELRTLLALVVYGATALASFAALSLRKPLPAIVVFLVLLGFGLTIDGVAKAIWLPFAFVVLAGCLLTLSRSLARERWSPRDAVAGSTIALLAALFALFLLGTTSLEASKPWQDWRTWDLIGDESSRLDFDWTLDYPSLLDPQTDAPIMRVESPVASYWRANALDDFDGVSWSGGWRFGRQLPNRGAAGSYTYTVPVGDVVPLGRTVTEVFKTRSFYTDFLFAGGTPTAVAAGRQMTVYSNGVPALKLSRPLGPELEYELTAIMPQVKPVDLAARGRDYPPEVIRDTELPFPAAAEVTGFAPQPEWRGAMNARPADREWRGLYQLNQDIVKRATDPYEIALRIEQYVRANYTYSLAPPSSSYQSAYAAFLFDTKTGYCQHFAGAMAALLRFNGIPARVAVGFTTGARVAKNAFVVSRTDAHSWVEAFFPRVGWIPFDPTPGRRIPGAGASSTSAGFVDPFEDGSPSGRAAADSSKRRSDSLRPHAAADTQGGAAGNSAAPSGPPAWLPWTLGLAAALLAWPFGRGVLRRRGLHRGGPDGRLRASLALVYAELGDYGVRLPRSLTLEETSWFLKEYLDLDATLCAGRVEAVLFGGRAVDEQDLAVVAELRIELKRRLRARRGWVRAVVAWYGLGSLRSTTMASTGTTGVSAPGVTLESRRDAVAEPSIRPA